MLRNVLGVIVGYIAIFVVIFVSLTFAYLVLGAEGSFQPGSYDVSATWIVVFILVGLIAAIIGGAVCGLIANGTSTPKVFAVIVLVLGLLSAIPVFTADESPARDSNDVPMTEAMTEAQQPIWAALFNPLLGAVGVLIGGRLTAKSGKNDAN